MDKLLRGSLKQTRPYVWHTAGAIDLTKFIPGTGGNSQYNHNAYNNHKSNKQHRNATQLSLVKRHSVTKHHQKHSNQAGIS